MQERSLVNSSKNKYLTSAVLILIKAIHHEVRINQLLNLQLIAHYCAVGLVLVPAHSHARSLLDHTSSYATLVENSNCKEVQKG